jgi:hypothetical protein
MRYDTLTRLSTHSIDLFAGVNSYDWGATPRDH